MWLRLWSCSPLPFCNLDILHVSLIKYKMLRICSRFCCQHLFFGWAIGQSWISYLSVQWISCQKVFRWCSHSDVSSFGFNPIIVACLKIWSCSVWDLKKTCNLKESWSVLQGSVSIAFSEGWSCSPLHSTWTQIGTSLRVHFLFL
jgi:hypothetical protein